MAAAEQGGKAEPAAKAVSFAGTQPSSPTAAQARFTRKKMSPLRRKIAQQLVMAQHTAAILTTFNECDMSAVQELRAKQTRRVHKKTRRQAWFDVVLY